MHDDHRLEPPARLGQDLQWKLVGDDVYFPDETESPVSFIRVSEAGQLVTLIWASTDDVAGGVVLVKSGGDISMNGAVKWNQKMRLAKARELRPLQAIGELLAAEESIPGLGKIDVAAGLMHCGSLVALETLANPSAAGGTTSSGARPRGGR